MSKVNCYGKHLLLAVVHEGIVYDCIASSDCKHLYECDPKPKDWVEIENIIRDAAFNLEINNLDEFG